MSTKGENFEGRIKMQEKWKKGKREKRENGKKEKGIMSRLARTACVASREYFA